MKSLKKLPLSAALLFLNSCSTLGYLGFSFQDRNPIRMQIVNLFNQHYLQNPDSPNEFAGDWLFRRERLANISQVLKNSKPEMIFFQEAMQKRESDFDSDEKIFLAGPLAGYHWRQIQVSEFKDTDEIEYLGAAISPPHSFDQIDKETLIWTLGNDGHLVFYTVNFDSEPIGVFHVIMPSKDQSLDWYYVIANHIESFLKKKTTFCQKRWVVVGQFSEEPGAEKFQNFLSTLHLKDTASGFCENAQKCNLSNFENPLSKYAVPIGSRPDRILVPEDTTVYESYRNLNEPFHSEVLEVVYNIDEAWPTLRMGWQTQVRLPRCSL